MRNNLLAGIKRGEVVLEARGITKRFPGVIANDHIGDGGHQIGDLFIVMVAPKAVIFSGYKTQEYSRDHAVIGYSDSRMPRFLS